MKKRLRLKKGVYVFLIYVVLITATLMSTKRFERLQIQDFRNTNSSIHVN